MTTNSIRRSRAYSWETEVVRQFQDAGFSAWRLGGTTTKMPDVLAVEPNTPALDKERVYGVECKSTRGSRVYFPRDQIQRCRDVACSFGNYTPVIVLASFFARKARKGGRTPMECLYVWPDTMPAMDVMVTYDGDVFGPDHKAVLLRVLTL